MRRSHLRRQQKIDATRAQVRAFLIARDICISLVKFLSFSHSLS